MNIPFELHVALRYLKARRYSVVSALGVGVGVMALVIALALMTGLQSELRDRILGATAHVFVWKQSGLADYETEVAALKKIPHVKGAAPAILGKAMILSQSGETFISLKGIDPVLEADVSELEKGVTVGKLSDLTAASEEELDGIFLGKDLAQTLAVGVGDRVDVVTPQGTLGPGGMIIRPRPLRVAGIYFLNLYEYDSTYGFVSLPVAERLMNKSQPELIELTIDDIELAPEVAADITRVLGPRYITQDWTTMNRQLFEALWLEKMAISITISLIVIVAALNIVGSLVLLVMEKRADIAILKTMGASSTAVMYVFILQGLIIGLIGTAAGTIAGVALSWVLDHYRLIRVSGDVYQISYLPFTLLPLDLVIVIVAAVFICFIATIYPSRQAARLKPVEALRYG
jgi:lipoprotein-releasing system permease protein